MVLDPSASGCRQAKVPVDGQRRLGDLQVGACWRRLPAWRTGRCRSPIVACDAPAGREMLTPAVQQPMPHSLDAPASGAPPSLACSGQEQRGSNTVLARVTADAQPGGRRLYLSSTAGIRVGQMYQLLLNDKWALTEGGLGWASGDPLVRVLRGGGGGGGRCLALTQ